MPTEQIPSASPKELAKTLGALEGLIAPRDEHTPKRKLPHPDEVTPSCSDSQYP